MIPGLTTMLGSNSSQDSKKTSETTNNNLNQQKTKEATKNIYCNPKVASGKSSVSSIPPTAIESKATKVNKEQSNLNIHAPQEFNYKVATTLSRLTELLEAAISKIKEWFGKSPTHGYSRLPIKAVISEESFHKSMGNDSHQWVTFNHVEQPNQSDAISGENDSKVVEGFSNIGNSDFEEAYNSASEDERSISVHDAKVRLENLNAQNYSNMTDEEIIAAFSVLTRNNVNICKEKNIVTFATTSMQDGNELKLMIETFRELFPDFIMVGVEGVESAHHARTVIIQDKDVHFIDPRSYSIPTSAIPDGYNASQHELHSQPIGSQRCVCYSSYLVHNFTSNLLSGDTNHLTQESVKNTVKTLRGFNIDPVNEFKRLKVF